MVPWRAAEWRNSKWHILLTCWLFTMVPVIYVFCFCCNLFSFLFSPSFQWTQTCFFVFFALDLRLWQFNHFWHNRLSSFLGKHELFPVECFVFLFAICLFSIKCNEKRSLVVVYTFTNRNSCTNCSGLCLMLIINMSIICYDRKLNIVKSEIAGACRIHNN